MLTYTLLEIFRQIEAKRRNKFQNLSKLLKNLQCVKMVQLRIYIWLYEILNFKQLKVTLLNNDMFLLKDN